MSSLNHQHIVRRINSRQWLESLRGYVPLIYVGIASFWLGVFAVCWVMWRNV